MPKYSRSMLHTCPRRCVQTRLKAKRAPAVFALPCEYHSQLYPPMLDVCSHPGVPLLPAVGQKGTA